MRGAIRRDFDVVLVSQMHPSSTTGTTSKKPKLVLLGHLPFLLRPTETKCELVLGLAFLLRFCGSNHAACFLSPSQGAHCSTSPRATGGASKMVNISMTRYSSGVCGESLAMICMSQAD